ncbi:MAG TPA: 5'-nucleotidase, lipoprotein e(P4) family [Sphingobacteriaceae bacterium]
MKIAAIILLIAFPITLWGQSQNANPSRDFINTVLWQQRSGEYRALAFQAYNFARLSLDCALKQNKRKKPPKCIIVDIDETVLDNSPFQGHELHKGISFLPEDWYNWTARAVADTVPGAFSFLKYAESRKVEVFYVTNRDRSEFQATLQNLKKFNFPFADENHLLVKDKTSDKEPRRTEIAKSHKILLLCGDNLNDFSDVFYLKGREAREVVNEMQGMFGYQFIMLPNPMYGDWEQEIYRPARNLSESEKADLRLKAINGY